LDEIKVSSKANHRTILEFNAYRKGLRYLSARMAHFKSGQTLLEMSFLKHTN